MYSANAANDFRCVPIEPINNAFPLSVKKTTVFESTSMEIHEHLLGP